MAENTVKTGDPVIVIKTPDVAVNICKNVQVVLGFIGIAIKPVDETDEWSIYFGPFGQASVPIDWLAKARETSGVRKMREEAFD